MADTEKDKIPENIRQYLSNKKIIKILKAGTKKFDKETLEDCICLSNVVTQENTDDEIACDKLTIEADKDSFIIGRTIGIGGYCNGNAKYVRLFVFGPGDYGEGIEIASPKVSPKNDWHYSWSPEYSISPGVYSFVVYDAKKSISDEVKVKAEKGGITVVAYGNQSYYIGEKIQLAGTCLASNYVYLYIIGPPDGLAKKLDQPTILAQDNDPNTFVLVPIFGDNTWKFTLDTSLTGSQLEQGIYTIFAIEGPFLLKNHVNKAYGSVSIIIKKPFISATSSQSTIVKGDPFYITGTAPGSPYQKVQIWIFGEDFFHTTVIRTNPDYSFSYEVTQLIFEKLAPGQYYVIAQHPMMNNEFDIYLDETKELVLSNSPAPKTPLFSLVGPEKVSGFNAVKKLLAAFNNPQIDDSCTRLQFLVEVPVIKIDKIGNRHSGDKFIITAKTNLAVDDEILVEVYQLKDQNSKLPPSVLSGATGVVKVTKGDSGANNLSFDVDTTSWSPGTFVVKFSSMIIDVSVEINFSILP